MPQEDPSPARGAKFCEPVQRASSIKHNDIYRHHDRFLLHRGWLQEQWKVPFTPSSHRCIINVISIWYESFTIEEPKRHFLLRSVWRRTYQMGWQMYVLQGVEHSETFQGGKAQQYRLRSETAKVRSFVEFNQRTRRREHSAKVNLFSMVGFYSLINSVRKCRAQCNNLPSQIIQVSRNSSQATSSIVL